MSEALAELGHEQVAAAVRAFRDGLRAHQERLNRLNVYPVPDGDTGTNMALTLESVVAEMEGADDMAAVCRAVGHGSLMGARGNSGVILSQMLRGMTDRLRHDDAAGPEALAEALAAGSAAAYKAVMKPVEGTILTVAREAAEAATGACGGSLVEVLETAAEAARASVERTPELLPVLAAAGVVDAGGAGFALLLDALLHVTDGRPLPHPPAYLERSAVQSTNQRAENGEGENGEGQADGGRYEVMYLLDAPDDRIDAFKAAWEPIGDSIVVVGGDGLWNCHIHTDDIGAAVEAALDAGRPKNIRVTDLAAQVEEERWVRRHLEGPERHHVATAVVAVAAGDGLVEALHSLGVQEVVAGGQSANPSTAEILHAVEATTADTVIVLPNNKNVVPVARAVPDLASKPVLVVPTTGIVGGLAALMAYDPAADVDANARAMADAVEHVVAGEVIQAVRDASTPAGDVQEGDWLGLAGHEIVLADADLAGAACALLDRLVDGSHELVTVLEGAGSSPEAGGAIARWLAEERPGVEVQVHSWGLPHAAYVFSIE